MTRIKTAVIGAGHLGKIHARLMVTQPLSWFDSIVEPFEAARGAASDEFAVDVYADHRDVIGKVEAAVVAAPTTLHHAICRDYLSAGIHVLVEKPITQTLEQAQELVSLARKYECVLQVGHVERFNPAWKTAAAAVGDVRFMEAHRTSPYTFRSTDVGVVLDLMIHDLDLLLSLTNSEPVDVCATGQSILGPHEDIAYATIRFADGMAASLHASRCSDQPQRTAHLFGELGARNGGYDAAHGFCAQAHGRAARRRLRPRDANRGRSTSPQGQVLPRSANAGHDYRRRDKRHSRRASRFPLGDHP